MNKNYLIIGLIILALVTIGIIASRPGGEMVTDNINGTNDSTPAAENPSVQVSAQTVSNGQIAIDRVISQVDSWVVIHRTGEDGAPDTSSNIGSARVTAGNNSGIMIDLTEEVDSNEVLVAMLYTDAGEFGTLEIEGEEAADTPVVFNDRIVETPFTVMPAGDDEDTTEEDETTEEDSEESETETEEESSE